MRYITILIIVVFIINCTSAVERRKNEIEDMLTPLMNKSREEVVLTLGPPTEIKQTGELEIYQYYQYYGTKSKTKYLPPIGQYGVPISKTKTWERYDLINIYFRDGKMMKWDCTVER
ncbi:hypothetical protein KA005_40975 [bacterium]|nr:hypothetical protein [bacterium]